ncbi:phenylacetate--CoA ligase family protein [Microbacterium protaetiae]|uniref:Phenylacetate--CoA ligase family protein n=1 Tax=Microbacterium protaetiae TaxID=2509458 RepID=A0A4P6EBC3_9MICO|nr:AMP-binding protein [Microbacterium protaetiae]QAY59314.1 phenylacetate--CoA ligase family protein [Microbacterium protaetiae]
MAEMEGMRDPRDWATRQSDLAAQVPDLLRRLRGASIAWRERLAGVEPGQFGTVDSLADLPFMTKGELRAMQADATREQPLGGLQVAATRDLVQVISSSGTTGDPMFFGVTVADWTAWKRAVGSAFATAGIGRGSLTAHTTGMPMVAGGIAYADGIREAGGTLAWVGGQTMTRMVAMINRLGVNTLLGTASFATFFAEKCEAELGRPARELAVRTVIAGGEPGLGAPEIRERIADVWGATRVSEIMGLGDVLPVLWAECAEGHGMHFTAAPHVLVELIDPETGAHLPWEPGVTGEAVYTTIDREACPVVRFRSRDQLSVTGVACRCGRTTPTVRCIGRTDDMLIYKAMNVYPSAIRDIAMQVGGSAVGSLRVRKDSNDQVRFDDPIPLEIELAADDSEAARLAAEIAEAVRQELRVRVSPEVLAPGSIPLGEYKNALTYAKQ